jgi:hypothetical protein
VAGWPQGRDMTRAFFTFRGGEGVRDPWPFLSELVLGRYAVLRDLDDPHAVLATLMNK